MWETCHSETIQSQEFPIKVSVFYQLSYIDTVGKESIFCCNNLYPNAPLQAYLGVTVKDEEMEELKIVVTSLLCVEDNIYQYAGQKSWGTSVVN